MTATSHASLISVLSLVVAILAVFFGPLAARLLPGSFPVLDLPLLVKALAAL